MTQSDQMSDAELAREMSRLEAAIAAAASDEELQHCNTLYFLVRHSDQHLDSYPVHDVDAHHRPDIFIGENTDTLNGF